MLDAEPADPQARKDLGLKPKSFASAASEPVQPQSYSNSKSSNDMNGAGAESVPRYVPDTSDSTTNTTASNTKGFTANDNENHAPTFADAAKGNIKHDNNGASKDDASKDSGAGVKVLNIVETHGEGAARDQKKKDEKERKLQEDKDRKKHEEEELLKKVVAQQDAMTEKEAAKNGNTAKNQKHKTTPTDGQHGEKSELEAVGLDEAPKSPTRNSHRKSPSISKSRSRQTSSSSQENKASDAKENKDTVVFEKFEGHEGDEKLTSVKPTPNYEKQLVQDRKEDARTKPDQDKGLVSGREALKSWDKSGIRFAPWNIPLQRRLQTAIVLFHTLCIALGVSAFFFICAIPLFWPLMIPYLIYCLTSNASTSGTLRLRSERFRSSPVWSLFASYFPARLHRSVELKPTRKYIFGYHPHGIISHGAFAAFGTEALGFKQLFPGITNSLLTLESNFRIPLYRDYALAMGLASVSKESCENLLSKGGPNGQGMGRAITIVVGGARESLDAIPNTLRLVLKRRLGFIKIAMKTGADLVPVIAFGENDLYDQFMPDEHPKIHRFQLIVKRFMGFTIPLFHARGVFNYDVGLMPYRRPLNIVVGRPIQVEQSDKPDQQVLEKLHEEYMAEVQRLWDTWKGDFAPSRREEMQFVE